MKDTEKLLEESLNKVEFPKDCHCTVDMLIENKAKKDKKFNNAFALELAACFIVTMAMLIFEFIYFPKINNDIPIQGNNNQNAVENEENNIAIIDETYSLEDIFASSGGVTPDEILGACQYVAIVKIEKGTRVTNYDILYGPHNLDGTYGYTNVRTIGELTIMQSLKGDLKVGDKIEFKQKGGKILYEEYIKMYEGDTQSYYKNEIEEKYKGELEKGAKEVYVDVARKDIIRVEEGKEYLVYMYRKTLGDCWLAEGEDWVREYNRENNTILNNKTGEWELLDTYIEENIKK